MGIKGWNQEIGLSFAVVFALGAKLKSCSILVAGTELNTKDDSDGLFVLVPDGRPKNDFDELVSLVSDNTGSPTGVDRELPTCAVVVGLSVFPDTLRIDLGGKDIPEFLFSDCGVADAVGRPESAFDEFLNFFIFL